MNIISENAELFSQYLQSFYYVLEGRPFGWIFIPTLNQYSHELIHQNNLPVMGLISQSHLNWVFSGSEAPYKPPQPGTFLCREFLLTLSPTSRSKLNNNAYSK